MDIRMKKETVISKCKGLSCLCFAAMDIAANQYKVSEQTKNLLSQLSSDAKKFGFSPEDIKLVSGVLENPDMITISSALWKLEELGILLWTLGVVESVPPIWCPFDERALMLVGELENHLEWRTQANVAHYREYLRTVNWRFQLEVFQVMGMTGDKAKTGEIIAKKVEELRNQNILDDVVEGDIAFDGVTFARLNPRKSDTVRRLAETRLGVLDWLASEAISS